ncbi:MAG: hypothetical protein ABI194_03295 [Gemmatimonadaceae bacterium]
MPSARAVKGDPALLYALVTRPGGAVPEALQPDTGRRVLSRSTAEVSRALVNGTDYVTPPPANVFDGPLTRTSEHSAGPAR